jgi:SNF2 family DNA or RNA helicase
MSLFEFQEEGVRFALEREGTLIADEMGLGKTCQAIGLINEDSSIRKITIVCPASMRIPWRRELERWLKRSLAIGVMRSGRRPFARRLQSERHHHQLRSSDPVYAGAFSLHL